MDTFIAKSDYWDVTDNRIGSFRPSLDEIKVFDCLIACME